VVGTVITVRSEISVSPRKTINSSIIRDDFLLLLLDYHLAYLPKDMSHHYKQSPFRTAERIRVISHAEIAQNV
jgi:hypothetical protein